MIFGFLRHGRPSPTSRRGALSAALEGHRQEADPSGMEAGRHASGRAAAHNRHARHPVNALLNYGYAILESQVRIAIAELGIDPTIGYLHVCQSGRQAFVYDLMEPYRPQVDRGVLAFIQLSGVLAEGLRGRLKGACRLHPELARNVAGACVVDIDLASVAESLLPVGGDDVSGGRAGSR